MNRGHKPNGNLQTSPEAVSESAETVSISDNDSEESVVVVCNNNNKKDVIEKAGPSQSKSSEIIEDNLRGQETSKMAGSDMSSTDVSCTDSPSRRKAGRKSDSKSLLLDENDLKHLRTPFSFGWKRELVYRNTGVDPTTKKSMCDIYYFPPSGKKLRSMVEISAYLESQKNSPVNLTHFTFQRKPLFHPPHEIVRTAGKPNNQAKKVSALRKIAQKQTPAKPKINNSKSRNSEEDTTEEVDLSEKIINPTHSTSQLTLPAEDNESVRTSDKNTETQTFRNSPIQVSPAIYPRGRGRPKGSKNTTMPSPIIIKRHILPKPRRLSPEWTPESAGYTKVPQRQKHVEVTDSSSQSDDTDDHDDDSNGDDNDDDDDDYSELQDVLGTPSKLIASIIRPDPPKRALDVGDEDTSQVSKKMRFLSDSAQSLSESGSSYLTPGLANCSSTTTPRTFVVSSSHFVPSNVSQLCNPFCPGMVGIEPCHHCKKCGQLYHQTCTQLELNCTDKSVCRNCARNQLGRQQLKPQKGLLKLVSTSIGSQRLGSIASSVVLSPCVVSSMSSVLSKPLMTSSSQFMPQVLSPIFLIPGQNAATIPPPPPLASCPRFDTPVTFLPVQLSSSVPPPPRLQLCTFPQTSHPPPLHAGPGLPLSSHTVSLLTHQPELLASSPLLTSKPAIFQPVVTTSSRIKIVSKVDQSGKHVSAKYLFIPAPLKLSQPDPLAATALQTPVVTCASEQFDSTGAIVLGLSGNTVGADKETASDRPGVEKSTIKTVRNMLRKRMRTLSPLSGSDIDDYPPVSFGPVTTENLTHLHSQLENSEVERQKSNFYQTWLDDRRYSTKKPPRMIKDMLNRSSLHPDLSEVHTVVSSNSQLLTVPHSVLPRLELVDSRGQRTANTELLIPFDTYSSIGAARSLLNFKIFEPDNVSSEKCTTSSHPHTEGKNTPTPKLTRMSFMSSFRILQSSFPIMMKIFQCLSVLDLLRASCVCKVWHLLGLQPELWRHVVLDNVRVTNWEDAALFLHSVGVKSLNLTNSVLEASGKMSSADVWRNIQTAIPKLTGLERLFFEHVPMSVLDVITEKMPHLVSLGAGNIIDSSSVSVVTMITTAKTVENMSHAIEAVTSGRVSISNASKLFQVSEKDLIHLTQKSNKLTSEEEKAVLLCCLRLSRMGFSVQKDTVVSKCQEMFAKRYLTTYPFPISESSCSELYHFNAPLFAPETEVKSSDTLRDRLNTHFSSLRRLYSSLWPRAALNASQVLMFDLKPFHLDKEPGFNSLRSVAVTVLSVSSACPRSLPVTIVWPKYVETTHPCITSVMSKRGSPTYLHVFQYFQKILSLVKERPLVILCNGNASLLSERLISTCVADLVYLYCVPPDIAEYVFPGFHGGLLHILKAQIPNSGLNFGEFASRLLTLLKSQKKTIIHSAMLAFTKTGAFPLNPRAPTQFQAVDLNIIPRQQFPWRKSDNMIIRKSDNLTRRKTSHPSMEAGELIVLDKPYSIQCNEATNNQKEVRKGINEHGNAQLRNKAGQKEAVTAKKSTGKGNRLVSYARMIVRKALRHARRGHNSWHAFPVQIDKLGSSSPVSNDHLNETMAGNLQEENTSTHQVSAQGPLGLGQDNHTNHEESSVDHATDMDVELSDIAHSATATSTKYSQDEGTFHKSGCEAVQLKKSTNVDDKKPNSAHLSCETNPESSPYKGSSGRMRTGRDSTGATLTISHAIQAKEFTFTEGLEEDNYFEKDEDMNKDCSPDRDSRGNKAVGKKMSAKELSTCKDKAFLDEEDGRSWLANDQVAERKQEKKNPSSGKLSQTQFAATSKDVISENGPVDETNSCGEDKNDTDQESRLKLLQQISLIDHDYILKVEKSPTTSGSDSHDITLTPEPSENTVSQVEPAKAVKTLPQVAKTPPQSVKTLSQVAKTPPQSVKTIPKAVKTPPQSVKTIPKAVKTLPQSVKTLPQVVKTLSQSVKTLSQVAKTIPKAVKTPPQVAKTLHQVAKTPPKAVRTLPQGVKTPPKAVRTLPQGVKTPPQTPADNVPPTAGYVSSSIDTEDEMTDDAAEVPDQQSESTRSSVGDISASSSRNTAGDISASSSRNTAGDISASSSRNTAGEVSASSSRNTAGEVSASSSRNTAGEVSASSSRNTAGDISASSSRNTAGEVSASSSRNTAGDTSASSSRNTAGEVSSSRSGTEKIKLVPKQKLSTKSSRNTYVERKLTKDESSSSCSDSQSSEEESGDSSESDESKQASDLYEEEEEEEDDDDSKCQMCMRSTPPHSKDEIIDWIDCDENCGRWFHVICVVRSHSKADAKHFVCPSCR